LSVEPSTLKYFGLAPDARLGLRSALFGAILLPLVCFLIGWVLGNRILMGAGMLIATAMTPLCISFVRQLRSTRLGVGLNGLFLTGPLGREEVHLPWEAIERLHLTPHQHGIILREPLDNAVTKSLARASRIRFSSVESEENVFLDLASQQLWVPFEKFSGWLTRGKLIEELREFAPNLANDFDQVADQFAAQRKRRRIWLAFLVGVPSFLLVAFAILVLSQVRISSGGQIFSMVDVLAIVPSILFGLFILVMIPLLAYYAWVNVAASIREFKDQDVSAALTCLGLAIVQAGFAIWIVSSIIFANRQ